MTSLTKSTKSKDGRSASGKWAKVQALVLDVDGVLTDGSIIYGAKDEIKAFNAQDGLGIRLALKAGMFVYIVTSRESATVARRGKDLRITGTLQAITDKRSAMNEIMKKHRLSANEVVFMGDDWIDLPAMHMVGLPVAVGNARPEVKKVSCFVTRNEGGRGAIREIVDKILKAKGLYHELLKQYV